MRFFGFLFLFALLLTMSCDNDSVTGPQLGELGRVTLWYSSHFGMQFLDTEWFSDCYCGFEPSAQYPSGCVPGEVEMAWSGGTVGYLYAQVPGQPRLDLSAFEIKGELVPNYVTNELKILWGGVPDATLANCE